MAWYHKILGIEEKLNPAQQYQGMAIESSREPTQNYEYYYENIEIVNRGVNMIVDDVAEGSAADKLEDICEGDILVYVNETKITENMEVKDVMEIISKSKRPIKLSFDMGDDASTDADD